MLLVYQVALPHPLLTYLTCATMNNGNKYPLLTMLNVPLIIPISANNPSVCKDLGGYLIMYIMHVNG